MITTQEAARNYAMCVCVCVCVSGTHKDALFAAQTRLSHRRGNAARTEPALSSHFSTTHTHSYGVFSGSPAPPGAADPHESFSVCFR